MWRIINEWIIDSRRDAEKCVAEAHSGAIRYK
jgi:hypothetical protein